VSRRRPRWRRLPQRTGSTGNRPAVVARTARSARFVSQGPLRERAIAPKGVKLWLYSSFLPWSWPCSSGSASWWSGYSSSQWSPRCCGWSPSSCEAHARRNHLFGAQVAAPQTPPPAETRPSGWLDQTDWERLNPTDPPRCDAGVAWRRLIGARHMGRGHKWRRQSGRGRLCWPWR